jgi:hypothetical protein
MAAGLGFKTFNTGDVLTASEVNGYLMQGILVFADATARDAAITSPQEGQFAFTKDNNSLWYYTGSAWAASGATGDIEGVTAGTGISGGGTSGTVTITNSMATAIDAKGDLIVGTGADTFDRLAVGTNGHTLVADSSTATGLKWAAAPTPATPGLVLIDEVSFTSSNAVAVNDVFSSTYDNYRIILVGQNASPATVSIRLRVSGTDTTTNYQYNRIVQAGTSVTGDLDVVGNDEFFSGSFDSNRPSSYSYDISAPNLAHATTINGTGGAVDIDNFNVNFGTQLSNTQFTGFSVICAVGITGKVSVYGYAKE